MTLALAACGGEEPAPQPPPAPPPPPEPTASASAAPVETPPPPPPPKPSLADLIPATLKNVNDAFNAHDPQKLLSYYTDDAMIYGYGEGEGGGASKGGATAGLQGFFGAFSDAKMAPTRVFIKGNVAVVEDAWTATMTGDFMGEKATSKPVGYMDAIVFTFNDDGLITKMDKYSDGAGLMAQVKGRKGAPAVPTLPTNPPVVHVAKGTPDEDKLVDLGKMIDSTMSKDDPKVAIAGLADDADIWMNFTGLPAIKGKKDLAKEVTAWFKTIPDQKWTATNVWGIDGFAIIEHTVSGTQKGALGPLPASNKPVTDWHFLEIAQPSADGKLQHAWIYGNLVELMKQTGALKKPGEKADAGAKGATKPLPTK
jgi:ketosteroid isomerase-like protein